MLKGHAFFAYATNYLIDLDHAVIVDGAAGRAIRHAEVGAPRTMIVRTQDRVRLGLARLAADSTFGSAEHLAWPVHERGIAPHIPVFDQSARNDGTFSRSAYTYDPKTDAYICPAGKPMRPCQRIYRTPLPLVDDDGMMRYCAGKRDCGACPLELQCCSSSQDPALDPRRSRANGARYLCASEEGRPSLRERKKVEMPFAHLKPIPKLDRLWLRGANGAWDEFYLAAAVQPLRKLAKLISLQQLSPA